MKEEIIQSSIKYIHKFGYGSFSVRNLANYMGISTRPLYYYFKSMKGLMVEISSAVLAKLEEYINKEYTNNSFLNSGVGYVLFAKELPHYYTILMAKEFWPNKPIDQNEVNTMIVKKASKTDLEVYNVMRTYTIGLAQIVSEDPENYSLKDIKNNLKNVFKLIKK